MRREANAPEARLDSPWLLVVVPAAAEEDCIARASRGGSESAVIYVCKCGRAKPRVLKRWALYLCSGVRTEISRRVPSTRHIM